jgi:hypothetical protein
MEDEKSSESRGFKGTSYPSDIKGENNNYLACTRDLVPLSASISVGCEGETMLDDVLYPSLHLELLVCINE